MTSEPRPSRFADQVASLGLSTGLTAPSPEIIDEIQRGRVVDALAATAVEHGYAGVTVERVLRHAHMSARTFYALFDSLEDWGHAAYRDLGCRFQAALEAAWRREDEWPSAVRAAIAAGLAFAAKEPVTAQFLAVEVRAGGPEARALQAASIERLAAKLREGRSRCHGVAAPNRFAEWVLVAGLVSLVGDRLLAGRPHELPALEPELVELALAPCLGAEPARRLARG